MCKKSADLPKAECSQRYYQRGTPFNPMSVCKKSAGLPKSYRYSKRGTPFNPMSSITSRLVGESKDYEVLLELTKG